MQYTVIPCNWRKRQKPESEGVLLRNAMSCYGREAASLSANPLIESNSWARLSAFPSKAPHIAGAGVQPRPGALSP